MTTKQVKKAYQKANKGPKLSKAERRRQELFEQDRIRKEFEKERNQARARAARDKKKEKEERERSEKKRKGLPLVEVRPSQDTIARFIRPKPKAHEPKSQRNSGSSPPAVGKGDDDHYPKDQEWEDPYDDENKENIPPYDQAERASPPSKLIGENDGLGCVSPIIDHIDHIDHDVERPSKKQRVGILDERDKAPPHIVDEIALSPTSTSKATLPRDEPTEISCLAADPSTNRSTVGDGLSAIDYIGDDFLEDFIRAADTIDNNSHPVKPFDNNTPARKKAAVVPPSTEKGHLTKSALPKHQLIPTSRSPAVLNVQKTPRRTSPLKQDIQVSAPHSSRTPTSSVVGDRKSGSPSRAFRQPRAATAPAPPKFKPAHPIAAGQTRTPQFLKPALPARIDPGKSKPFQPHLKKPEFNSGNNPPPSTQLFVLSHLDEFFPSPSQEVREIFDEPMRVKPQKTPTQPSVQAKLLPTSNAFEMPFFCTQDLLLSSQDVKDIEEESLSPAKPHCSIPTSSKPWNKPVEAHPTELNTADSKPLNSNPSYSVRPSPKPLFTSTCREMRYKYALERNKTTAWEGIGAREKAREELDQLRILEDQRFQELLVDADNEIEKANERKGPGSMRSSGSEVPLRSEHTHKSPNTQGKKTGINKTRLKSSYEMMVELLNKGPTHRAQPKTATTDKCQNNNIYTYTNYESNRNGDTETQKIIRTTEGQMQMQIKTIPASQETDYEWDDDDMLRDML